jgi:ketosteroid isomerase-like protein
MQQQAGNSVRQASQALESGNLQGFLDLLADDVRFHIPGRSELAGEHQGKEAVHRIFERETELCGGNSPQVEAHDVLANDQHGVLLHKVVFQRSGRTLEDNSVLVFQLREGKISEIWLHPQDLYANDEFWAG